MRNLIEKLLADGGEYLYIVQRSGLPRVSAETILSAYTKIKHGGRHE